MSDPNTKRTNADRDIFMKALEKSSTEERAAFLDGACGEDILLRRRVEDLLNRHFESETFMAGPAAETEKTILNEVPLKEGPGEQIGRYKLLQKLGEGGFGVVYMAEQKEPVRRRVALKIIKMGMDTQQVVARFEAERQALALMDHPNIARVLDAGATNSGRPFFVMELVKGVPITRYCDDHRLDNRQKLELFIPVCKAIQHAHQKGIIHRDIKPSNIMVTLHDGVPVPKVIDFGIAKATLQDLTEKTIFTQYSQFIGTPAYMSPEQAEMSGLDIDTRSDIYSLGVVLYELLTGAPPFDSRDLMQSGIDEMRRIIREKDPVRPSTRVSELRSGRRTDSQQTKTAPATSGKPPAPSSSRLPSPIEKDLDWIVLKSLEKDRTRRYETANGFAEDIRRFLNDEPVSAAAPGSGYVLKKYIKRHKSALAVAAVIAALLVIGTTVSTMLAIQAKKSQRLAEQAQTQESTQRQLAEEKQKEAQVAREIAEKMQLVASQKSVELARRLYLMKLATADNALLENNYPQARLILDECEENQRGWEWEFLNNRFNNAVQVLRPGLSDSRFSDDGKTIFAVDDKKIVTFEPRSGNYRVILEDRAGIQRIDIDKKSRSLAWQAKNGEELGIWDLAQNEQRWFKKTGHGGTSGMAFSPDGNQLAIVHPDGWLVLYEVKSGSEIYSKSLFNGMLQKLEFSPDGRWILVGGFNKGNSISPGFLVEASTANIVAKFPDGTVLPAFHPDGKLIASGNPMEKRINLWTWDGNELKHKDSWSAANSNRFNNLGFRAGGRHLATTQGNLIAVWDVETGRNVAYKNADWPGMALYEQSSTLTLWPGGSLKTWHYLGFEDQIRVNPFKQRIRLIRFSPDNKKIAIGTHRGQHGLSVSFQESAGPVVILDSDSGNILFTLEGRYTGFSWFPDSRRIAVTNEDERSHEIHDTVTGVRIGKFGDSLAVGRPFVSGEILASIGEKQNVWQWNTDSGKLVNDDSFPLGDVWGSGDVVRLPMGLFNTIVGPDGHLVALAQGGDVRMWDVVTKEAIPSFPYAGRSTQTLEFSRDSSRLYAITGQKRFRLFDVKNRKETRSFLGPFGPSVMNSDATRVVSCGDGVQIWDVESGLKMFTLASKEKGRFTAVDWSPDDTRIAVGQKDGTLNIWSLPTGD